MRDEGAVASLSLPDAFVELAAVPGRAATIPGFDPAPHPSPLPSGTLHHLLGELGITPADIAAARLAARINDSDLGRELVAGGQACEEDLASAMAIALDLSAEPILATDHLTDDAPRPTEWQLPSPKVLRTCDASLRPKLFIAPALEELDGVHRVLCRYPARRSLVRIATPRAMARHRAAASSIARSAAGHLSLAGPSPDLSARRVITGGQGFVAAGLLAALVALAWNLTNGFLLALHLAVIPLFLCGSVWRLSAASCLHRRHQAEMTDAPALPPMPHPVYTVLVALHREAEMLPDLVAALARLRWPRSKLEVMLVCEADDPETIAAAQAAILDQPGFEIVLVPPSPLRTKPKALNVALPLATGEFLVLYDAEDEPHPDQLEAAWRAFRQGGPKLACLQAPLVVRNGANSWLAGHFALEYAALFRGLLPWLSDRGLPMPLGGTSNHFRREALVAVGGWDSHNVTEDADLGIRLARTGHAIGTIDVPTLEEAPELWTIWLKQRTRWMKGWVQTWLVHMRRPARLWRDLGAGGFVALQILFLGMVGSALAHPLSVLLVLYTALSASPAVPLNLFLVAVDLATLLLGYFAYAVLLLRALTPDERQHFRSLFSSVYIYWLLISLAVLRALVQLARAPHRWEKTPHGASARSPQHNDADANPLRRASG